MADKPQKITKTIPFDGGRQDDVAAFRQDSPSMTRSSGTRFNRVGEVEKTHPLFQASSAGMGDLNAAIGTYKNIDGVESYYMITQRGELAQYDEAADDWATSFEKFSPKQNFVVAETGAVPNGMNFLCSKEFTETSGSEYTYRLVIYQISVPNGERIVFKARTDIMVEVHNTLTGGILTRELFEDASCPRVGHRNANGQPYVAWVDDSTEQVVSAEYSSSVGISEHNWSAMDTTIFNLPMVAAENGSTYDELRIGYAQCSSQNWTYDISQDQNDTYGFLAYSAASQGNVRACTYNSAGSTGTEVLATPLGATNDQVLAVHKNDTFGAILYQKIAGGVGAVDSSVEVRLYSGLETGAAPTAHSSALVIDTIPSGHAINGGVWINAAGTGGHYAYTKVGRQPSDFEVSSYRGDAHVQYGQFTTGAATTPDVMQNVRLASDVVEGLNSKPVFVVEQFTTAQPTTLEVGFATTPVHLKGVTPTLVEMDTTGVPGWSVLGAFDAGQSKMVPATYAEQSFHRGKLFYDSATGRFEFTNRVQFQPEDISYWPDDGVDDPTYNLKTTALYGGEAKMKHYSIRWPSALRTQKFGRASLINSSIAASFDGDVLGEISVLDQPEIISINNAGLPLPVSDFGYEVLATSDANIEETRVVQIVTGFTDKEGALHRSAPSFAVYTQGNMDENDDADEIWRVLRYTPPISSFGSKRDYFVEVYISQPGEDPQLAVTQPITVEEHTNSGSTSVREIEFLDSLTIGGGSGQNPVRQSEVIYTAGDVLPSDPWPYFSDFVITSNRLWGISGENLGTVFYSKLLEEGIASEFSAALVIALGRNRILKAIGKIDDKVIVFTKDEIFAIYDTGPDNTGANGDFIVDRLQTPYGCEDPESVLEITDGLMFFSKITGEFHLITRDLQLVDIGRAVSDMTGHALFNVNAAVVDPKNHEAIFSTNGTALSAFGSTRSTLVPGPARAKLFNTEAPASQLVYNYHFKRWSTFANRDTEFMTLYNDTPLYSIGDRANFDKGGQWYLDVYNKIILETPWIRTNQLQSFGRIDEITFLGKYLSSWVDTGSGIESGDIQVTLTYDYEEYSPATDVFRFRAQNGDLGTEISDRLQFSVHPGRPKCQAIKIRVNEVDTTAIEVWEPTYANGAGFSLSGADIIYSPKVGTGSKTLSAPRSK